MLLRRRHLTIHLNRPAEQGAIHLDVMMFSEADNLGLRTDPQGRFEVLVISGCFFGV